MKDVQARLKALGFDPGPIDGIWGNRTRAAIMAALDAISLPTVMSTSPAGIAALAGHEGFVPGPYQDSEGVWTIYVGHTKAAGSPNPALMPRGMPEDLDSAIVTGLRLFASDLRRYEAAVRRAITVPVAPHEFDAAVSFHYNTGGIHEAAWVKSLNAGERDRAADEIMNWSKPKAIVPRRQAEQALFRYGVYPNRSMTVWHVDLAGKVIWRPARTLTAPEIIEGMAA